MSKTNELVLAEKVTALQVFSSEGGLDPIIQEATEFVSSFKHDLSTGAGRKRTASLAAKVAKLKVRLDDMGKDLVSDWKNQAKKVDQSRKSMRESLDELKTEARKPLTDWEDEQERVKAEKLEQLAAERQAAEIEAGHEMALLMNEKVDRDAEEAERQRQAEADRIAREQAEREERLKHEAAENARIKAEQKAQAERNRIEQERLDALRREQEAKDRADQAVRDRVASEERAIQQQKKADCDKIEAEERAEQQEQDRITAEAQAKENARIQAEQAEEDRRIQAMEAEIRRKESEERARQQEIQRQQDEQARIQREQEQREADRQHVGDIRRQAKEALMEIGLDESTARRIVIAINNGSIDNVTINY